MTATVYARIEGKVDALTNRFEEFVEAQEKRDIKQDEKLNAHDKILDGNGALGVVGKVAILWEWRNEAKSLKTSIWVGVILLAADLIARLVFKF